MNDCFWGRIQPAVKVSDRPKAELDAIKIIDGL
jgi:hypothetical protein